MSNYGQTFTKGVKYLKIHKLDKNGEDYGQRLAVADNIRINYPDVGNIQYNILTTQQQEDYYLMGVIPQETTSSYNNINDYNLTINTTPPTLGNGGGGFFIQKFTESGDFSIVGGDNPGGYFDTSTSIWSFPMRSNVEVSLTASISADVNGSGEGADFILYLVPTQSIDETPAQGNWILLENFASLAGSISDNKDSLINNIVFSQNYYFVGAFIVYSGTRTFANGDIQLEVNQSISSTTSPEVLINITPEVLNFEYSDYNALLGNATIPQYSQKYQNVSYNTGLLSPTNIEFIRNGTAEKASINDSNYSQKAWSNSRYNGNRISSYDFNVANTNSNN